MKRVFQASSVFLWVLAVAGFSPAPAQALLLRADVASTFVVVDDVNDVQWADLNRFTNLTYEGVLGEIEAMNAALFAGAGDWHLAGIAEMEDLFGEVRTVGDARQFDPTVVSLYHVAYEGRYEHMSIVGTHTGAEWLIPNGLPDDSTDLLETLSVTNYDDSYHDLQIGAWVLSSAAAQAPVPEPATLILLGSGLIGLAGLKRRKLKNSSL